MWVYNDYNIYIIIGNGSYWVGGDIRERFRNYKGKSLERK